MEDKKKGHGHKKYAIWRNLEELSPIVFRRIIPLIPQSKFKVRDQIERAMSSIGANFIEGYYSCSTKELMRISRYSRRSLAELEYWVGYCFNKKFIPESLFKRTEDLMIRTGYLIDRLIISLTRKITS